MNWKPKSEEEAIAEELCPKGRQGFTVIEAVEAKSKKGQDMLALKLNVHGSDGFDYHVFDYISANFMHYKFRHFFYAIGQGPAYEAGTIEVVSLRQRQGYCEVGIQPGKNGFKAKSTIVDYLPKETTAAKPESEATPEDDDVPF